MSSWDGCSASAEGRAAEDSSLRRVVDTVLLLFTSFYFFLLLFFPIFFIPFSLNSRRPRPAEPPAHDLQASSILSLESLRPKALETLDACRALQDLEDITNHHKPRIIMHSWDEHLLVRLRAAKMSYGDATVTGAKWLGETLLTTTLARLGALSGALDAGASTSDVCRLSRVAPAYGPHGLAYGRPYGLAADVQALATRHIAPRGVGALKALAGAWTAARRPVASPQLHSMPFTGKPELDT